MNVLAVISARSGGDSFSGGRVIAGRPLLSWVVSAAMESRTVGRVAVAADDADSVRIARNAGADVVECPAELPPSDAAAETTLLHVLDVLASGGGRRPELVVLLRCEYPLITGDEIDQVVGQMCACGADSAFSAVPFRHVLWRKTTGGAVRINRHAGAGRDRRGSAQFLESGAVYAARTAGFVHEGRLLFGKTVAVELPPSHWRNIDDPGDRRIAEMQLLERRGRLCRSGLSELPKAVVFDFDGVFTDNLVSIDSSGNETVRCSRDDGFGIGLLKKAGFLIAVISTEVNPVVSRRCGKLSIECLQGIRDKKTALLEFAAGKHLSPDQVLFMGNDLNDLPAFEVAGLKAAPADAHVDVLAKADLIMTKRGGRGAIRELADLLLSWRRASCPRDAVAE